MAAKGGLSQSMAISDQIKKLGEGIDILNKELQKQVLEKHEDLLLQANHATRLDNVLAIMNSHVQNLFANVERLKTQINGPYNALDNHTKVLGRLHLASHILRQVNRIQQLSKRLGMTNDPIAKATVLHELEQLANDPNLIDVDAVSAELRNIREQQQNIVKLANGSLNQGINNENIAQTSTALQIFSNLGSLDFTLNNYIDASLGEAKESLKASLDISNNNAAQPKTTKGPGRVTMTSSASQGFRSRIWLDLEKSFSEEIYLQCKHMKFLQLKLDEMHSHNLNQDFAASFWKKLSELITAEIESSPNAVKQMLEEEYPKLLRNFLTMITKISYDKFSFHRSTFEQCENAYLSNSLTRLIDPTQSMFSGENNAPTHEQIDSITQIITR